MMAGQGKKLKSLADYLKPQPTVDQKRDEGAARVRAMLERRARKSGQA